MVSLDFACLSTPTAPANEARRDVIRLDNLAGLAWLATVSSAATLAAFPYTCHPQVYLVNAIFPLLPAECSRGTDAWASEGAHAVVDALTQTHLGVLRN